MDKKDDLTAKLYENLCDMFGEGSLAFTFDLNEIDGTEFFTALFLAMGLLFNRLTEQETNALEFSHLCNKLIVQHMLEQANGTP